MPLPDSMYLVAVIYFVSAALLVALGYIALQVLKFGWTLLVPKRRRERAEAIKVRQAEVDARAKAETDAMWADLRERTRRNIEREFGPIGGREQDGDLK